MSRQPPAPVSVLFEADEIAARVREMGEEIARDYAGRSPVLVSILKGGTIFLADLARAVDLPVSLDFMGISSFGGAAESMGRVRIVKDLDEDIGGRDVLVVEDIVDTGLTLSYLRTVLLARDPASLAICTLLDKTARRIVPTELRYVGFECPDSFVVGYGLDLGERYRNVPSLVAVHDLRAVEADPGLLEAFLPPARLPGN